MRGSDAILWLWVTSASRKPSDPAGDAQAVTILRSQLLTKLKELGFVGPVGLPHDGKHHDVSADIRRLQGRIAQFHFKNGPKYLDDEKPKFEAIAAAINEINYKGWIVLETSNPSNHAVADSKRNGYFTRRLFSGDVIVSGVAESR